MVETRQVTQYRLWHLYAIMEVNLGSRKENGKKVQVTRDDRVLHAVFDDVVLLKEYCRKQELLEGQKNWESDAAWIEYEPEQSRFSIPLNPKPNTSSDAQK